MEAKVLAAGLVFAAGIAHGIGCNFPGIPAQNLTVRDGYLDYIAPADLKPLRDALPTVADAATNTLMRDANTIWYDEASMVFFYQDSIEVVVGGRANCVGRRVGEENANNPPIHKLVNLFGPDYRFMFPFRAAAGTDDVTNVHTINFWVPPTKSGVRLPVKYWRTQNRGRYYWTFPVGTVFGEVLFEKSPDGKWVPFEVRTRKRYNAGWTVDLFRPFVTADSLATAVTQRRGDYALSDNMKAFVDALRNPNTLQANKMASVPYAPVFTAVNGALDPLPALDDSSLITDLLTQTPFVSAEGQVWKRNGTLETYAPASQGDYSIVPKGYAMGMIPVNEVSCNRCHTETGRRLGDFDFDVQLYGEIWGEDRIFTWHLFEPNQYIYETWDEADSPTRKVNPRLVQAKLVQNAQPAAGDPDYFPLPSAFDHPLAPTSIRATAVESKVSYKKGSVR